MGKIHKQFGALPIAGVALKTKNKESLGDIMFVHMSWGGAWAFEKYMKFFASAGYNTYAVDMRGHGDSGGMVEGATMQDYVEDVRLAVISFGLDNPVVVGHSMGGLVALMYAAQHKTKTTIILDGSPSLEVQKTSEEKQYEPLYTPQDSGMPSNPFQSMKLLPDMYPWNLMKLKFNLKFESGVARSERKLGISVPKEKILPPLLFIGAELGTSLPFGIGIEKSRAQAEYYDAPIVEIKGATHPGLLIGKHWKKAVEAILDFLNNL